MHPAIGNIRENQVHLVRFYHIDEEINVLSYLQLRSEIIAKTYRVPQRAVKACNLNDLKTTVYWLTLLVDKEIS